MNTIAARLQHERDRLAKALAVLKEDHIFAREAESLRQRIECIDRWLLKESP